MTEAPCKHPALVFAIEAQEQPGSNVRLLEIAARCAACEAPFTFLGRIADHKVGVQPYISEQGQWLPLSIIPEGETVTLPEPLIVMPGSGAAN